MQVPSYDKKQQTAGEHVVENEGMHGGRQVVEIKEIKEIEMMRWNRRVWRVDVEGMGWVSEELVLEAGMDEVGVENRWREGSRRQASKGGQ